VRVYAVRQTCVLLSVRVVLRVGEREAIGGAILSMERAEDDQPSLGQFWRGRYWDVRVAIDQATRSERQSHQAGDSARESSASVVAHRSHKQRRDLSCSALRARHTKRMPARSVPRREGSSRGSVTERFALDVITTSFRRTSLTT